MKKILVLITFLSLSLPAFSYISNIDLICTFVSPGTDVPFSIEPLYIDYEGNVYDSKNNIVGSISNFKDRSKTEMKVFGDDVLLYTHKNRAASYFFNHNGKRLRANGSCKIQSYKD